MLLEVGVPPVSQPAFNRMETGARPDPISRSRNSITQLAIYLPFARRRKAAAYRLWACEQGEHGERDVLARVRRIRKAVGRLEGGAIHSLFRRCPKEAVMRKLWWSVVVVVLTGLVMPTHTQDGRWKLGGDGSCYFDANDSGPNQCEPGTGTTASGRWSIVLPRPQR